MAIEDVLELAVTSWEFPGIHKHRIGGGSFLQGSNHIFRKVMSESAYRTFPGSPEEETGSWTRTPTRIVDPSKTPTTLRREQRLNVYFHQFAI